jgi:hypothetical protein
MDGEYFTLSLSEKTLRQEKNELGKGDFYNYYRAGV